MADEKKKSNAEFLKWFKPLIEALKELGGSATPEQARNKIIEDLNLSDDVVNETYGKSNTNKFSNQVAFARNYLVYGGYLDKSKPGIWALTESGKTVEMTDSLASDIFVTNAATHAKKEEDSSFNEKIEGLIAFYRKSFVQNWSDEKFKWEAVKCFQDNWNENEEFEIMFKKATKKAGNLLGSAGSYPLAQIFDFTKEDSNRTKEMFAKLYDESIPLEERIENFKDQSMLIIDNHNKSNPSEKWISSFQNENSISTYLWLRYPDKYYIYKFSEFSKVERLLTDKPVIKKGNGISNLLAGFELYNKLAEALKEDEEISRIFREFLTESCYPDPEFRTLAIDFVFQISRYYRDSVDEFESNDMDNEYKNFKCLLEYFVSHLEYVQNQDTDFIGYNKYIKEYVDEGTFKKTRRGWKGDSIRKQVEKWEQYDISKIFIAVTPNHGNDYKSNLCYLNWKGTGINIIAGWNKENHISGLCLHVYNDENRTRKNIGSAKSLSALGLFDDLPPNQELKQFFDDFKKLLTDDHQNVINEIEEKEMEKLIEQLKSAKNLIFTGAPGTGKTFLAEEIAEKMGAEHKLVQFHPSYDYTDFVEGLRPVEKNGTLGFERKDGAFKEFCELAIKNLEDSKKSKEDAEKEATTKELIEDFISDSVDSSKEYKIATGNKFYITSSDENYVYINIPANDKIKELSLQKSVLIDLLNSKEKLVSGNSIRDFYKRKWRKQEDSYYLALYNEVYDGNKKAKSVKIETVKRKDFVFIIDEINRGEVSKIFGELFYAIDPGYRGNKDKAVQTQYQNLIKDDDVFKDGFYIPENVYIIGTMNDIDRSVESIDFAFRRRFTWKEITAEDSMSILDKTEAWEKDKQPSAETIEELKNRLRNLNEEISRTDGLNSSYHIGASYLLKYAMYEEYGESEALSKLWDNHLKCVLFEYLRGRPQIEDVLESLKSSFMNKVEDSSDELEEENQES